MACRVVKEDALPLTLAATGVEECLLEENHLLVEVEQVVAVGDPWEGLVLTEVEEVVQPSRDASRDVEGDEQFDESPCSNLESAVVPAEEHRRTIDEAYLLDSVDFEQLAIVQQRYRVFLLSRRV